MRASKGGEEGRRWGDGAGALGRGREKKGKVDGMGGKDGGEESGS